MAEKSPLVFVDGGFSQLPPGDSIVGIQAGVLTAGSGLVGGGDLSTGQKRLDLALAPNPSGLIFVGDSLGLDGVAQATAVAALASGNAALSISADALASGVAAQTDATAALASGNAALLDASNYSAGTSLTFTAANDIKAGYAVGLDDAGKVQSIRSYTNINSRSFGSPYAFNPYNSTYISSTYDSSNNKVVITFMDSTTGNYGYAIVGSVSGDSITFGARVMFRGNSITFISTTYDSLNNKVVICFRNVLTGYTEAIVGTVSGTSISFGSVVTATTQSSIYNSATFDSTNNSVVLAYTENNNGYGTAIVGSVSGTSISFGTPVVYESASTGYTSSTYSSGDNRVAIAYTDFGNSNYGTAVIGTVSGTSISFGSPVVYESSWSQFNYATYDSNSNKIIVSYVDYYNSSYGTAIVGTISGTSISFGTAVVFESAAVSDISATFDSSINKVIVSYRDNGNSFYGTSIVGTVSGTSISFGTATVFEYANTTYTSSVFDSSSNKVVVAYTDSGNSNFGTVVVSEPSTELLPTVTSQNNFIGIAQSTVASGTDVNVFLPRTTDLNQTGLSPGYFYYVNPTTSGFTTASGQPTAWSGAYNWGPVGKAVSSSGLLLLNPM